MKAFLYLLLCLPGGLSAMDTAHAGTTAASAASTQAAHAHDAIVALQRQWGLQPPGGRDWSGTNAWQRVEIVEALLDYGVLSGDRTFMPVVEAGVRYRTGLEGNDDDLWAVIAAVRVHALDGDPALLAYAEDKQQEIVRDYWDGHCGGGLWWNHARTYKNAITNELLIYASALLYQATHKQGYLDQARKTLDWFNASGMINADHLVNDGLDARCANNGETAYTYNQGVILGALAELYEATGTAAYLDQAAQLALASTRYSTTPGHVLHEPGDTLSQDGQSFKGIYIRHLALLAPLLRDPAQRRALETFIQDNARRVWETRDRRSGRLDAYWDGEGTAYGAAAQGSGIDAFNAAMAIQDKRDIQ